MYPTVKSLGLDQLSRVERILLVEELWDSIAAEADALDIPQSHKEELDRRLAAYHADPSEGSDWQDVRTRLQKSSKVAS